MDRTYEHELGTFTFDEERGAWRRSVELSLAGSTQEVWLGFYVEYPEDGPLPEPWPAPPTEDMARLMTEVASGQLSERWREVLKVGGKEIQADEWALLSRLVWVDVDVLNGTLWTVGLWLEDESGNEPDRYNDLPISVDFHS
ncbi:MAG: hypothetical protein R3B82_22335 [Sandaracinaceae bacterium]